MSEGDTQNIEWVIFTDLTIIDCNRLSGPRHRRSLIRCARASLNAGMEVTLGLVLLVTSLVLIVLMEFLAFWL